MKNKTIKKMLEAHPLAQIFVLNAIINEAERISKTSAGEYPARGLIDGHAWIDCANTLKSILKDA